MGENLCTTQIIQLQPGKINLNADYCDLDVWPWERLRMQAQIDLEGACVHRD